VVTGREPAARDLIAAAVDVQDESHPAVRADRRAAGQPCLADTVAEGLWDHLSPAAGRVEQKRLAGLFGQVLE